MTVFAALALLAGADGVVLMIVMLAVGIGLVAGMFEWLDALRNGLSEPDVEEGSSGERTLAATPPPIRKDGGPSGSLSPSVYERGNRNALIASQLLLPAHPRRWLRVLHAVTGHHPRSDRIERFGCSEWWATCECGWQRCVYMRLLVAESAAEAACDRANDQEVSPAPAHDPRRDPHPRIGVHSRPWRQ